MNMEKCRWEESCGHEYCNLTDCPEYAKIAANHIPLHSWPDAVIDIYLKNHVSKYGAWLEWLQQPWKEDAG